MYFCIEVCVSHGLKMLIVSLLVKCMVFLLGHFPWTTQLMKVKKKLESKVYNKHESHIEKQLNKASYPNRLRLIYYIICVILLRYGLWSLH